MPETELSVYPWSSDVVFAADLDGDGLIQRANRALRQSAGDELTGVPFAHLIAPEQQPAFERRLADLADEGSLSGTFAFPEPGGAGAEDRLVWLHRRADGAIDLIAEPAWSERDRLVEQVLGLNDDLIATQRVAARRQRALELAEDEAARSAARVRRLETILLVGLTEEDFDAALHRLLRIAQELLAGDRADILLLDEATREMVLRASAGRLAASEDRYGQAVEIGHGLLGSVARSESGLLVEDLQAASRLGLPTRQGSLIGVPLRLADEVIGMLVASAAAPAAFGSDDLRLLELVGERIALAIGQAQVREREQRLAETLQRSLLPQSLPDVPGLQVAARYLPHTARVGGDFYDAIGLEDGRLGLAIGDVTGKGLRAAAAMGRLRSALHAYALDDPEPANVLRRLGRLAQADDAMATALYLTVAPASGEVTLASAGHLPPLCVTAGGARYLEIRPALSPPLGLRVATRRQMTLTLLPGSTLVLYTDGLVERTRNIDAGMAKLAEVAGRHAGADPEALADRLLEALAPDGRYRDDVAVLALRRL